MGISIQLNGQEREISEDLTVTSLLSELGVHQDRVAVELNLDILDKGKFPEVKLKNGDKVEIIGFVGGGWS